MPIRKKYLIMDDDSECDYEQPQLVAMKVVLFDVNHFHPDITGKMISLSDVPDIRPAGGMRWQTLNCLAVSKIIGTLRYQLLGGTPYVRKSTNGKFKARV